jgi:phosphoglycerate dehydrogenase-like enzyme
MVSLVLSSRLLDEQGDRIAASADGRIQLVSMEEGGDDELARAEIGVSGFLADGIDFMSFAPTMSRLRWVHSTTAGVEHLLSLPEEVVITNAAGAYGPAIAEYVVWGVVTLMHRLDLAFELQRTRAWDRREELKYVPEIHGSRVGIVGYGEIGRYTARAFRGLGAEVWATRRTPLLHVALEPLDRWLPADALGDLLPACDVVVLAASLNSSTRKLIGMTELVTMRPGAILVNISRGDLVDEEALVAVLSSSRLGGAVLDVTTEEPLPPESPLWGLPNVIVTPHISGDTTASYRRAVDVLCVNLPLFLGGRFDRMANVVDREAAR